MDTLTAARAWVKNGFSVIPLYHRSKRPAFSALKCTGHVTEDGNCTWKSLKNKLPTDDELWLWFAGPRRNLGVITGFNGLVVLDFDERALYDAWMTWAAAEGGQAQHIAATTYRVFSARGVHVYLVVNEPVESFRVAEVDIKAKWGYVLAPPSVHPNGHQYYSQGASIARCERLSDVFPFERPSHPIEALPVVMTSDPWEAASRAVVCEGDSITIAKQRLQLTDLVQIARQDCSGAWALCPLHRDANPSLRLYEDGHYHCFGCGAHGGDVIDLYAALHRMTTREAIAALST